MPVTATLYPYAELGHANHGWLDARHHFSFARYWNPDRTHFGTLRVINDDKVAAGRGFAPHDHDNMEIITYVRSGAISHRDSMGNEGRTGAGDVQVMSAGRGVTHSEFNLEDGDTTLYQIWIIPNKENVEPRWDMKSFPSAPATNSLSLLVSGQTEHGGQGALYIHQDAAIYGGRMLAGITISQTIKHQAYLLASAGSVSIKLSDGKVIPMERGDGLEISGTKTFEITAVTDAEILVLDVPQE
jgi:hypothetical protein